MKPTSAVARVMTRLLLINTLILLAFVASASSRRPTYLILLLTPQWATVCGVLVGSGTGTSMTLALAFMGLRVADGPAAAALSAMAQSIGYLLASTGPVLFGLLYATTATMTAPILLLCVAAAAQAIVGYRAVRGTLLNPTARAATSLTTSRPRAARAEGL